jgi:hypothetical protein
MKERNGDEIVRKFASSALEAFRKDAAKAYSALAKEYEGKSAAVGVFGVGSCVVAVHEGEVKVNPRSPSRSSVQARAAVYPETLQALTEGKMSVLEAFFGGDLVAQASAEDLHGAYANIVRHADAALKSDKLKKVAKDFLQEIS